MKIRAYITHKDAEKYSDCADYFGICPQTKRVAVSDGVSQSIMPLEWAKILIECYLSDGDFSEEIKVLQSKWLNEALSYLKEQRKQGKNPWMLENCINNQDGAGATFCGVTFGELNQWKASVLGDSCLVLIDKDNNIKEIISSKEGPFDNKPDYFDSFKEQRGIVKHKDGTLTDKEKLLLVSDPFSELFQKFMGSAEQNTIITKLLDIKNYEDYLRIVDEFRVLYKMHNDDSTCVIVEPDGKNDFNIIEAKNLDDLIHKEEQEEKEKQEEQKKRTEEEESLWAEALKRNTIEAYKNYLSSSIILNHKVQAEDRIRQLEDEELWNDSKTRDSIESYTNYLSKYSKGIHQVEAKNRINEIKKMSSGKESVGEEPTEPASEDPASFSQRNEFNSSPEKAVCLGEKSSEEIANASKNIATAGGSESYKTIATTKGSEPNATSTAAEGSEPNATIAAAESSEPNATSSAAEGSEPNATIAAAEGSEPNATSSEAEGSEPNATSTEAEGSEPNATSTAAEGSESDATSATAEGSESDETTRADANICHPAEVAPERDSTLNRYQKEVAISNSNIEITIPSTVDASDGIDEKEFMDLLPTARALFMKYASEFRTAFNERKWRGKPEKCFEKFWSELEQTIYTK